MSVKILHVINTLDLGGAEILLRNTLPLLDEYEHVVCYLGGNAALKTSLAAYTVHCLEHRGKRDSLRSVFRLHRIIRDHKIDIVHAHLFYSTLLARLACPRSVKFVFTIHNLLSKDAFEVNRLALWAEKLTYKKRHAIIGVSAGVISDYDAWIGVKGKTFVLYNYIEDKYFTVPYAARENITDYFKLVAVGNLRRQKNYQNLLQAFALLKEYPVSLDIYGGGDLEKDLQDYINQHQLPVTLKGRVQDVSVLLPAYDAYIMCSLFEGYGIAPMEAMAAGMPVLLSDIEVFREVAEDRPRYFNPADPTAIAAAILDVYHNWQVFRQGSYANRQLILGKASDQVYKGQLVSIYQSILKDNH